MASEELDRTSYIPLYRQLATILRQQIRTGALQPGDLLPSEPRLGQQYNIGTLTARQAIRVLRGEGLVETVRGVGNRVREMGERTVYDLQPGDRVRFRRATDEERRRHALPEGAWVAEVARAGGDVEVYAADLSEFQVVEPGG
jgi:DNA-binding transcriptional regulator YhcF (GntR family)